MSSRKDRIAVVVVHGMGNQYPMETLRSFCEGVRPEEAHLYSSPNRITEDQEVRRLSFSKSPFDYFEYYWAHQMEEPSFTEVMKWSFKLLFWQKPSPRLRINIWIVRLFIFLLLIGLGLIAQYFYRNFKDDIMGVLKATFYGISLLVVLRIIWETISKTVVGIVQSSVGDVIKYTIPSPKNISVRDKIRKNGIDLVKRLHEAKGDDGLPKYSQIVVVGHSLGSIVAYDILTSLFADYHADYLRVPGTIHQEMLDTLFDQYHHPDHAKGAYQNLQGLLFNEYRQLGNQWRVSHFITMGSPLTHASMILTKGVEDLKLRQEQREYPISPPQMDHADKHFTFHRTFNSILFRPVTIKILHHAALFATTQWTNVYYTNDWIGGPLEPIFGKGIRDVEVKAESMEKAFIPMATHTLYWDTKETHSLVALKQILQKIQRGPVPLPKKVSPAKKEETDTEK